MHSDGIWNDLKLQRRMKTMSLKHAFWRYLKRFGTAEKNENNVSKACILSVVKTIRNCRENINNVSKACILSVVKTIGNCRENIKQCLLRMFSDTIWNNLDLQRNQSRNDVGQLSPGSVEIRTDGDCCILTLSVKDSLELQNFRKQGL